MTSQLDLWESVDPLKGEKGKWGGGMGRVEPLGWRSLNTHTPLAPTTLPSPGSDGSAPVYSYTPSLELGSVFPHLLPTPNPVRGSLFPASQYSSPLLGFLGASPSQYSTTLHPLEAELARPDCSFKELSPPLSESLSDAG